MCKIKSFTLIMAGEMIGSAAKSSKKATISGNEMNSGIEMSYSFNRVDEAPMQLISLMIVGLRYSNM